MYSECKIPTCATPVYSRGFCRKHYEKDRIERSQPCKIEGCLRPAERKKMCNPHYRSDLESRTPKCLVVGCDSGSKARGYCAVHYKRIISHGSVSSSRSSDWGARQAHPLYQSYHHHRRGAPTSMCKEWADDFWAFVDVVGDRPINHKLSRVDTSKPLGPDNWVWKEAIKGQDRKDYTKKYREANKRATRNNRLKAKFGITIDDFERISEKQGHVCAICGSPPRHTGRNTNLCVDHCHTTGKVRGLLCDSCNRGIGLLKDNPNILLRAVDYLR